MINFSTWLKTPVITEENSEIKKQINVNGKKKWFTGKYSSDGSQFIVTHGEHKDKRFEVGKNSKNISDGKDVIPSHFHPDSSKSGEDYEVVDDKESKKKVKDNKKQSSENLSSKEIVKKPNGESSLKKKISEDEVERTYQDIFYDKSKSKEERAQILAAKINDDKKLLKSLDGTSPSGAKIKCDGSTINVYVARSREIKRDVVLNKIFKVISGENLGRRDSKATLKGIKIHVYCAASDNGGNLKIQPSSTARNSTSYIDGKEPCPQKEMIVDGVKQKFYVIESSEDLRKLVINNVLNSKNFTDEQKEIIKEIFDTNSKKDAGDILKRPGGKELMASLSEIIVPFYYLKLKEELQKENPDENNIRDLSTLLGIGEGSGISLDDVKNAKSILWSTSTSEPGWDFMIHLDTGEETGVATSDATVEEAKRLLRISMKFGAGHAPDFQSKIKGFETYLFSLPEDERKNFNKKYKSSFLKNLYDYTFSYDALKPESKRKNKIHIYMSWFLTQQGGDDSLSQEDVNELYDSLENNTKISSDLDKRLRKCLTNNVNKFVSNEKAKETLLGHMDNECWPASTTYIMLKSMCGLANDKTDKNYDLNQEFMKRVCGQHPLKQARCSLDRHGLKVETLDTGLFDSYSIEFKNADGVCDWKAGHGPFGVCFTKNKNLEESCDLDLMSFLDYLADRS